MNRNTASRALGIAHSIVGPMGTMRYTDQGALDAGALDQAAGGTRIVYRADVLAAKGRIDAKVKSVSADVARCTGLAAADRSAWAAFESAWRQFYCRGDGSCGEPDASYFGLGGQMDDCETYEAQLYAWQQKLAPLCAMSAPVTAPPLPTAQQGGAGGALRWATIGLGILAGLYVLHETGVLHLVPRRRGCTSCGATA